MKIEFGESQLYIQRAACCRDKLTEYDKKAIAPCISRVNFTAISIQNRRDAERHVVIEGQHLAIAELAEAVKVAEHDGPHFARWQWTMRLLSRHGIRDICADISFTGDGYGLQAAALPRSNIDKSSGFFAGFSPIPHRQLDGFRRKLLRAEHRETHCQTRRIGEDFGVLAILVLRCMDDPDLL